MVERIRDLASQKSTNIKNIEISVGLGNGTIRRWDEVSPSVEKLLKVADFLNVSMDYLVKGEKNYSPLPREDQEWLDLIHSLSPETQRDFKGAMRLHADLHEIADREEQLRQAK
ncbi:MAG: helix-turn-helix domain-containing protein [Lachnospiraceae bacterium]|nr:helix-turn-helix domain-containing protein [Lachnospiraceae bacterium]